MGRPGTKARKPPLYPLTRACGGLELPVRRTKKLDRGFFAYLIIKALRELLYIHFERSGVCITTSNSHQSAKGLTHSACGKASRTAVSSRARQRIFTFGPASMVA